MKKTLLVAAMMASFTGAAVAQSSVTLYGRIAPSYVYESVKLNDTAASTTGNVNGTYNQFTPSSGWTSGGNNVGFKGVEDLGNGLKASFKYELAINGQTDGGMGTAREAHLTLSNKSWGSVEMGYGYTASSTILSGISPVGTSYGVMSAEDAFSVFSVSAGNQVKYFSPNINGLTVGLSYSFSGSSAASAADGDYTETFGTSTKNRLIVAGLRYANGPIVVAGAYTQLNPNSSTNTTNKQPKNWTLGGTYDLKVAKLHAAYGQNVDGIIQYDASSFSSVEDAESPDVNPANGLVGDIRTDQWMAGVSAPVGGAGKVYFSISQQRPGANLKDALNLAGNKAFSTMTNLGVAYQYSLSKRTAIKGAVAYASNYGMVDGLNVTQIGVGLEHKF